MCCVEAPGCSTWNKEARVDGFLILCKGPIPFKELRGLFLKVMGYGRMVSVGWRLFIEKGLQIVPRGTRKRCR